MCLITRKIRKKGIKNSSKSNVGHKMAKNILKGRVSKNHKIPNISAVPYHCSNDPAREKNEVSTNPLNKYTHTRLDFGLSTDKYIS